MSFCKSYQCPYVDEVSGKCTFSGNCVIKSFDSQEVSAPYSIASSIRAIQEVVFNPFQRGNGCIMAGYTRDEILAHTR